MVKKVAPSSAKTIMGMTMTTPAIISLIAYLVLAFVIIMPFEFPVTDQETGEEYIIKYDFAQRLIILLLMSIPIALSVYTINCMMVGNCTLWSYVVAFLSVFWVLLFIITAIIYTMKYNAK